MQHPALQVDLVPSQRNQLAHPQAVAVGEQDQQPISQSVPSDLACSGDQALDLSRREVLAAAPFQIGQASRRPNLPI
jgi:hypothetical protein